MSDTVKILRELMTQAQIRDYLQLSRQSQVSELQFYRLENNLLDHIPLGVVKKIAKTLNIPVTTLIDYLSGNLDLFNENYQKNLQIDNQEEISHLITEYQQETISILESLLLQLPTLIHVINNNPELPASRILPLLQPLNQLLSSWEIEPIGQVGDIVNYNPQEHELMENNDLSLEEIQLVEIRYVGYRQKDKLLYRAKVSLNNEEN
ncbi:helix-turn-helix transcriptional regulator [Geminocystis sp. GBBB08]|uniref:helix-turn-helix transcriptional regulator n=1 Tax=Geminocystis sp. GBBB08 TaxID=2604140 RepID=UPI0027E254FE|nr:helix-turn-helix transcriptional regulator [Geminocystis sp. GBBB08]MBL1209656.1 helix-turn-helix transcriptional regulator [Geminocystis sp. GBBB08]